MSSISNGEEGGERFNRRNLLKTIGIAGGAGILMPGFARATNEKTTIVTDRVGDTPIRTKRVPKKWLQYEKKATEVLQNIQDQNPVFKTSRNFSAEELTEPRIHEIGLVRGDEKVDGLNKSRVEITFSPDAPRPIFPSDSEGVPIELTKRRATATPYSESKQGCKCGQSSSEKSSTKDLCNDEVGEGLKPAPGGIRLWNQYGHGMTSTTKVWFSGGNPGLMTCAHTWDDHRSCGSDLSGEPVNIQGGDKVGDVAVNSLKLDFVVIDNSGNETQGFGNWIAGPDGTYAADKVVGHKTEYGLRQLMDSGGTIYKMGVNSCESSGQVEAVGVQKGGNCFYTNEAVRMSTNCIDGDSGGPHFDRWRNPSTGKHEASIIAPLWGGEPYEYGTGAYHIVDNYPIQFGN